MATWSTTAQLTTGTLAVGATDRIWYNSSAGFGTAAANSITVAAYQDTMHITSNVDTHLCTTNHVNNTKYLTATTVSINGAGSTTLAAGTVPTTAQAPILLNFADAASVATSATTFYFYDGTTDATAMVGITVQAIEAATSTSWVAANGSGAALSLANQAAATSHNFYIATSVSPTSTGNKSGKQKITLTYV